MLKNIITGKTPKPLTILLYGEEKIGKSRFCADFPKPIFLDVEDGLNYIDTSKTPQIKSSGEAIRWLDTLVNEQHDYKTVIIDSIDWLERLITEELVKEYNAKSITDDSIKAFIYGGANKLILEKFKPIADRITALRGKGVTTVLICHAAVKPVENPIDAKYEKFTLKLSKVLAGYLKEWAELILFAKKKFYVTKDGKATDWKPVLLTGNNPAFEGGGRMQLPDELELNYNKLKEYI